MSDLHARRVRELFDLAVSLDPHARRDFLERECSDDPELRVEVENLLADNPPTFDLPITPVAEMTDRDVARPSPPDRIGDYRIIRELGTGGMGIVYEAEQASPKRRVALKVIRGGVDDELRVQLFRREIKTLARLDHPDIATIYESGQAGDGQLYYAMELVKGEPLDAQLARAFTPDGPDRTVLDMNLRLFRRICDAVHFAHQHGVIHRDLKPSNILVGENPSASGGSSASSGEATLPRLKVLDFGLARVTDTGDGASLATDPGSLRGTLQFMSPEQAGGDPDLIDVRSDVYALGVMLYMLLTNRLPYEVRGLPLMEALRTINEVTPPSVGRSAPGTDPDLDIITMKALAKIPEERYQSAFGLGEDISRYLSSLPIMARPQSTFYQLRKMVRRHRAPVALTAMLVVGLAGFAVWMSVLYARAEENLTRAVEAEAEASRRAETASRISDFLTGLFEESDPSKSPGGEVTARDLLDTGSEQIENDLSLEPDIRASLQQVMGVSYLQLGLHEPARRLLRSALDARMGVHGESDVEVASILLDLGWVLAQEGHISDAEETARRAMGIATETGGPDHLYVGQSLELIGVIHRHRDEYAGAESTLTRVLRIYEREHGLASETVSAVNNRIANVYLDTDRFDEAESLLVRAIVDLRGLLDPDHPTIGTYLNNLASVYRRQGRLEEAEVNFLASLEIKKKALGEDHPSIAYNHNNLGLLYKRMERYADAETHLQRAIEIRRGALPQDHPLIAWTLDNLATLYVTIDRLEEADPLYDEALSIAEAAVGTETRDYAILESNQAWLLEKKGRYRESQPLREHVVEVDANTFGPESPRLVRNLVFLAENYEHQGKLEMAEPVRRRALEILKMAHGPEHEPVQNLTRSLADLLRRLGKDNDAAKLDADQRNPASAREQP